MLNRKNEKNNGKRNGARSRWSIPVSLLLMLALILYPVAPVLSSEGPDGVSGASSPHFSGVHLDGEALAEEVDPLATPAPQKTDKAQEAQGTDGVSDVDGVSEDGEAVDGGEDLSDEDGEADDEEAYEEEDLSGEEETGAEDE